MSTIKVLNAQQIEAVYTLDDALAAVEQAYAQKHTGEGMLWPMVFHEFEQGVADLDIKSGNLDAEGVFGLKLVSWFGENPAKGHPALYGTILLFDRSTGEPKALMNAGAITELRTGAAGAIGAKYLAKKNSEKLLMVGSGGLAPNLIAATLRVLPGLKEVCVINPHHPEKTEQRLQTITAEVDAHLQACGVTRTASICAAESLEQAVGAADIILTATPSYSPLIQAEWVKPGTHLSCVGADLSGKEEVDAALFGKAKIFGDDEKQCLSVGECEIPYQKGIIKSLHAEIGAVIAGADKGRTSENDITLFDSTGIALQDLASAAKILQKAAEQGIGTDVNL